MTSFFSVDVPATSANMGPGFDCFGLALNFHNNFSFKILDNPEELIFTANFVLRQNPKNNLVYRAYSHCLKRIGYSGEIPGVHMNVFSKIPSARGLGSSASAVVAGILLGGAVSNTNLKLSEAIQFATEVEGHPDNVAPAILGGMTVSIKEKNYVFSEKVHWPDELAVLVAIPDLKIHTHSARSILPKRVSLEDAVFNISRASVLISSLQNKDWEGVKISMFDRLHQSYRASMIKGLNKIINISRDNGALGATLSGSGPSVLITVLKSDKRAISRIKTVVRDVWRKMKINCTVEELAIEKNRTRIKTVSEKDFEHMLKLVEEHNKKTLDQID